MNSLDSILYIAARFNYTLTESARTLFQIVLAHFNPCFCLLKLQWSSLQHSLRGKLRPFSELSIFSYFSVSCSRFVFSLLNFFLVFSAHSLLIVMPGLSQCLVNLHQSSFYGSFPVCPKSYS